MVQGEANAKAAAAGRSSGKKRSDRPRRREVRYANLPGFKPPFGLGDGAWPVSEQDWNKMMDAAGTERLKQTMPSELNKDDNNKVLVQRLEKQWSGQLAFKAFVIQRLARRRLGGSTAVVCYSETTAGVQH